MSKHFLGHSPYYIKQYCMIIITTTIITIIIAEQTLRFWFTAQHVIICWWMIVICCEYYVKRCSCSEKFVSKTQYCKTVTFFIGSTLWNPTNESESFLPRWLHDFTRYQNYVPRGKNCYLFIFFSTQFQCTVSHFKIKLFFHNIIYRVDFWFVYWSDKCQTRDVLTDLKFIGLFPVTILKWFFTK